MKQSIYIILTAVMCVFSLRAQTEADTSPRIEIPELKAMHETVYSLWHEAYPRKDIRLLKSLYPQLEADFRTLQQAHFPGQWPDRRMHWQEKLADMQSVLKRYKNAMDRDDQTALLNAAEDLHSAYENLIRIVNPPIPAVDRFHEVLYRVYHEYLPDKKWAKIGEAAAEFQDRMEAVKQAALPGYLKNRQEKFDQARSDLSDAVDNLTQATAAGDTVLIGEAVEELHDAYTGLEAVME